jgi:hypothetical protein
MPYDEAMLANHNRGHIHDSFDRPKDGNLQGGPMQFVRTHAGKPRIVGGSRNSALPDHVNERAIGFNVADTSAQFLRDVHGDEGAALSTQPARGRQLRQGAAGQVRSNRLPRKGEQAPSFGIGECHDT